MKRNIYGVILILMGSALLFMVSFNCQVKYSSGDPQLTLLTSQSLLEQGTTNLYHYYTKVTPEEFSDGEWKYTYWKDLNKVYYFYPIGSSIISIPFVAIARSMGYNFINKKDDALWQSTIASISLCIIFFLLIILASCYVDYFYSIGASFLFCLGTSLMSTIGTALWSFNFEIIFLLLSFIHITKTNSDPQKIKGLKLGIFIFLAWLCRPSALIVFILISTWLLFVNRKQLIIFLATIFILYLPLGMYAITHFNLVVPAYYHPLFWTHMAPSKETFLMKLLAILFSPARGLFLFTPVLLLSFLGLFKKVLWRNYLFIISLLWFSTHTFMLARQTNWWGGWSFGPRLFSDSLIPLFIMVILSFRYIHLKFLFRFLFVLLSIPGIIIHSVKGANDIYTVKWNDNPNIDTNSDFYVWNMHYPQFLADSVSNENKKQELLQIKKQ